MLRCVSLILLALSALASVGCGQQNSADLSNKVYATAKDNIRFRVETVASGLEVPWAFTWLPNDDMLFTERTGLHRSSRRAIG